MRVLIVEPEVKVASFIRRALEAESFGADVLHSGEAALAAALRTSFDTLILNALLPDRDGFDVLRTLRKHGNDVPILLLCACDRVEDRIAALNAGADDCLGKPFVLGELIARVHALCRRPKGERAMHTLSLADLSLDRIKREAKRAGSRIDLCPREYALLEFLLLSQGKVCSPSQLLENVWRYDGNSGSNLISVYINRLRRRIDHDFEPKLLHTLRNGGYVLKVQT